jgi:hypothetical protein
MVGNAKDEADRRDAYAQQAVYERNLRYRQQKAMSNGDVINMVANGASDPLIISTMRSRGGNFDVSPQSVIFLHNNGVSDNVIQAMQGSSY